MTLNGVLFVLVSLIFRAVRDETWRLAHVETIIFEKALACHLVNGCFQCCFCPDFAGENRQAARPDRKVFKGFDNRVAHMRYQNSEGRNSKQGPEYKEWFPRIALRLEIAVADGKKRSV